MTAPLLGPKELMAILGMGKTQFYKLAKTGAFDRFKVHPPIGRRCYSAHLIDRWQRGELALTPIFGRKRSA